MTVNPGFAGQKKVCFAEEKIRNVRAFLKAKGFPNLDIEADGNCSMTNIASYKDAGANIYVLGTSSLYRKGIPLQESMKQIRLLLEQ